MHPEYFKTRFFCPSEHVWPAEFAIISAYATTGEHWSPSQNADADSHLVEELAALGHSPLPVTGYSPTTTHEEPSWAVKVDFTAACDIGQRFEQDAIYCVIGDTLFVSFCYDCRRKLVEVGPFRERVTIKPLT